MPCPHCNAPVNAADRFCVACGRPLPETDVQPPAESAAGSPLPAESAAGSPLPAESAAGSPLPAESAAGNPLPAESAAGNPLPAESPAAHGLPAAHWRGGQAAMALLIVGLAFLSISGLSLLLEPLGNGLAWAAWVASHAIGIVILATIWLLGNDRRRVSLRALAAALGLNRPRVSWLYALLLAALATGLSLAFTALYAWAITLLAELLVLPLDLAERLQLPPDIAKQLLLPPDIGPEILFPGPAALLTFEALAGWTAFTEELFFRGFVFAGLIPRWGLKGAAVGSALIFSVFHIYPGVLLPIFVTGLLLAGLYRLTGSLWPPVLAHAGQNALALLAVGYA